MAGCPAQRFTEIGPEVLAMMQTKGKGSGIAVTGTSGQTTVMGVTVRWDYDPAGQVLVVECTDAPFFVPCSTIQAKIKDLVESCRPKLA